MPVTIDGSNTPTAGGVGYGDGTELAFTTAGSAGQVLLSNGAGAPSFGAVPSVNLATGVTGTLPVGNGGTGATTFTSNNVLLGNGASSFQTVAPGSSGNVLTSDGTTWQSSAPAGGGSMVLLQSNTGSATSTEFTGLFTSTYNTYKIFIVMGNPSSSVGLGIRYYVNNLLEVSSAYQYTFRYTTPSSSSYTTSSGTASYISIDTGGRVVTAEITISDPTNSTYRTPIYFDATATSTNSGSPYGGDGVASWAGGAGAITGIQLINYQGTSANISAQLYGIKKS